MGPSILIAKILSIAYLSLSISFYLNKKFYSKQLQKMLKDPGLMLLGALISLILGFIIINTHNIWDTNWALAITIIG